MTGVRRWLRRAGLAVAMAALALAAVRAPSALGRLDAFQVRRVEVLGTRFIEPYAVVRAAGLHRPASVFDDADAWEAGVRTLPLVASVRARRALPGTVTLEVREVVPVALVGGDRLRPVDVDGRVLPLEPAGVVLDLPILTGVGVQAGEVVGAGRSALTVLTALVGRAPEMAERISQVHVTDGSLRVAFRDDRAEAVLPVRPSDVQLTQLRVAFADLVARGELDRVRSIDVRFRDQVVVSFLRTPVS
ncbi:MAG: FtsQ-type POTRA domain-containing protein [Gemmatimonadetes bacterium]|nr:FtsQ-type POTRA domain-containing protein [Gemmatimonadota bacterium]NIQ54318.1 FtsQ-type POTRA domain-containing protein [Gemmatimonadota bacterium]NIU74528.1 FtsQ-type POTRA domain-containing protein [Gammaproteobacteria bacterium]NIX44472.1 FtsQ-type POTRA domain-containing protein [Gemmatimonadota bacterium]NIY08700.1 FtsQ-type POTRA domain-containing protein [Gemmatimonadota bacterium]